MESVKGTVEYEQEVQVTTNNGKVCISIGIGNVCLTADQARELVRIVLDHIAVVDLS